MKGAKTMDEIMEEIDFVNGKTPASEETMEAFQANIKNAIINAIERNNWKKISDVNISEGNNVTLTDLINAKEVMILHEKLNIYLVTIIPKELSGNWVKNQNTDIKASMSVNFSTGQVSNGSTSDTNTWIKDVMWR